MKNKILAMAAISSLCLLAACSDDSPDPTRAELCANGLSEDCITGTWSLDGVHITAPDGSGSAINPQYDYSAAPGSVIFGADKSFEYIPSTLDPNQETTYGSWSIEGTNLSIKTTVGNTTLSSRNLTIAPVITVLSTQVELNIGQVYFCNLALASEDNDARNRSFEVLTISAE